MSLKINEKLENKIENIAKSLGFDIEYIEFVKENTGNVFRIVLDKENDIVTVDDCENLSHTVEEIVDEYINTEYMLEVSSPGVERALKNIKLYKKYIGNNICVKMYKKQEFGKEFNAVLEDVNEESNSVKLKIDDKEYLVNIADIASAHTVYDFDAVLKNDGVNINELKKF